MKHNHENVEKLLSLLDQLRYNLLEADYPELLAKVIASNAFSPHHEILLAMEKLRCKLKDIQCQPYSDSEISYSQIDLSVGTLYSELINIISEVKLQKSDISNINKLICNLNSAIVDNSLLLDSVVCSYNNRSQHIINANIAIGPSITS